MTPIVPSTLKCDVGLLEQASERSLNDFSGTVTVAVEYSVLRGREGWDNPEVTARCSLFSAGGETFVPVTVDAVGERPDDSE